MAKYLGEQLAQEENENTVIVRTSWLYGGGKQFKNFPNTMLKLGE
jgi:dTDP-4-dehydrorhamnose reductase